MTLRTTTRRATSEDIAELVRLREVMWTSMGLVVIDDGWREACVEVLGRWLRNQQAVAVVVDHPTEPGVLIAGGVGSIDQRLPGSTNPSGRYGYIASMITVAEYRGQGLARAVLTELLDWFRERGVRTVDLHASAEGESLYRAAGFTENTYPALRWRAS